MKAPALLAVTSLLSVLLAASAIAAEERTRIPTPVGYQDLHPNQQINYQLNRCLTGGRLADLREIAPQIANFDDWKRELTAIAKTAMQQGRIHNAAYYYRYSCFFCAPEDPDRMRTYELFVKLIGDEYRSSQIQRFQVPYEKAFLPAMRLTPPNSRGTIVMTSGFDTYLEEYIPRMDYFVSKGYDVIVFNGPGQGAALMNHKLTMTHEWERPTSVVLDYFHLENVTLVGVSLGGYLAMRAAAFEPRIKRVVAFNVMYDFYGCLRSKSSTWERSFLEMALALRMDFLVNLFLPMFKLKHDMLADWFFKQGMIVTGTSSPAALIRELKNYNMRDYSNKITQDVLILAGSEDHYVPVEQLYLQMAALKNARSITGRIFTKAEKAQNHGQYGNPEIALATIANWIDIVHRGQGDDGADR